MPACSEVGIVDLYVQLEAGSSIDRPVSDFRSGFRGLLSKAWEVRECQAIVLSSSEWEITQLRSLWTPIPNVTIMMATVGGDSEEGGGVKFFTTNVPLRDQSFTTWRYAETEFVNPQQQPLQSWVPTVEPQDLLERSRLAPKRMHHLSVDTHARSAHQMTLEDLIRWDAAEVSLTIPSRSTDALSQFVRITQMLSSLGYLRAGRSWGAAGSLATFVKVHTWKANVPWARAANSRERVGSFIVDAREILRERSLQSSGAGMLHHKFLKAPARDAKTLDYSNGLPLSRIPVQAVIDLGVRLSNELQREAEIDESLMDMDREATRIDTLARECQQSLGVWPLSFSYPRRIVSGELQPERVVSRVLPGVPYAFDDEAAYLREYTSARVGITHRKAGWDCFRHLEILGSGCAPLMPDIDAMPKFTMIHYPKEAMGAILANALRRDAYPGPQTRKFLVGFTEEFLSSAAMARYLLRCSGLSGADSVVFVDEALPTQADYLSLTTLIGLKQVFGDRCVAVPEVEYLYDDYAGDSSRLYGRGFGYCRALPRRAQASATYREASIENVIARMKPDAVVVGSIARNRSVAERLLRILDAEKTIWIHGEDHPPSREEEQFLRTSQTHTFVRSIDALNSPLRRGYRATKSDVVW